MTELEEKREQAIQLIADLLRDNEFTFEYRVKKKPQGIKIIYELTQEELDEIIEGAAKKRKED